MQHDLIFSIFLIFTGAAILSTAALVTRQSMLVAYMLLGIILGPWGFKLVRDSHMVQNIGEVGIIFLLFLLGLHLPPQKLFHTLKKVSWVALVSSLLFAIIGFSLTWLFHYNWLECLIVGIAMMFSSTIIGIKLLPTTVLHHQHIGTIMIGILLMQDLIAIAALLMMHAYFVGGSLIHQISIVALGFPFLLLFSWIFVQIVLLKLFEKFSRIKEYLFLLAIAWCLCVSQFASYMGLTHEIGAFVAGVSVASSPISFYIAESLKPVRDFFLVMFFFSVGATFDLSYFEIIILPALLLVALLFAVKPAVFYFLLRQVKESKPIAWEIGARLGQISEFSLILAYVGQQEKIIGSAIAYLIQAVTILSFILSSYYVVLRYPTPVALNEELRRD